MNYRKASNKIDADKFKKSRKEYGSILSEKVTTLEEFNMFVRIYESILKLFGIPKEIIEKISYDIKGDGAKWQFFSDVIIF